MDPIDELLNRPIPEELWHYTSVQGFHGIVKDKAIFATDLRYLNDRQEFMHLRRIAEGIVQEAPEEKPDGLRLRKAFGDVVGSMFGDGRVGPKKLQLFVTSFTPAVDRLSQWRGYSHGSSGVSMAFDLRDIRPPTESGILVSFAPCEYIRSAQEALVRSALQPFKDEVETHWSKGYKAACDFNGGEPTSHRYEFVRDFFDKQPDEKTPVAHLVEATNKTRVRFIQLAALLKDPSFSEEEEWRLVLPMFVERETPPANPPRFRAVANTLIPYISHPLPTFPIVDLILGPGSHEHACFAAARFLRSEGINIIEPRMSEVPYRSALY
jgi:hypothetical protein